MIIVRIVSVTAGVRDAGIKRSLIGRYYAIVEILVESALLYSITILIFVVLLVRNSPHLVYPNNILGQISVRLSISINLYLITCPFSLLLLH